MATDRNPFKDADNKMSTGSSQLEKHDQGVADRTEKNIKANSDRAGNVNWDKVGDTHHSEKDNRSGRRK